MDPRYPVGTFEMPTQVTPSKRQLAIDELAATPAKLRAAAKGLSDSQLDTPYREGAGPSGKWSTTCRTAT
jgi:hypothetical protein